MLKYVVIAMAGAMTLGFCAEASSAQPAQAPRWDPAQFQMSPDGPCSMELTVASTVVGLRDRGTSRDDAAAKLIPKLQPQGPAAVSIANSALEDVYGNPEVASFPYFVYRNVTCMRRLVRKPTPPSLSSIKPDIVACQNKAGTQASDSLIACIQSAVIRHGARH